MSQLREQMEQAVASLEAAHEQNRVAYKNALSARDELNKEIRFLCDKGSVSANELGAAKKALEELNRNTPPSQTVTGEGEVAPGQANAGGEN